MKKYIDSSRLIAWCEGGLDGAEANDSIPLVNLYDILSEINDIPAIEIPRWIPCSEKLPEMHDAGILKRLGILERSDKCLITIAVDGEATVDNNAELRDRAWHSDFLRYLKNADKPFKVTAWMPLPKPYVEETE